MRKFIKFIVLLMLITPGAWAAYAHVQTIPQTPTNATACSGTPIACSQSFASTPAVGNLVIVWISYYRASTIDDLVAGSVSDNQAPHNTWTVLLQPHLASGEHRAIAYSILTTATGTFTVTSSFNGQSETAADFAISEFSGNAASAPTDGNNSQVNASSTTTASPSLTPTTAGDLFIGSCGDSDGNETYTVGGGFTKLVEDKVGSVITGNNGGYQVVAGTTAQTYSATMTTAAASVCLIAAFKPAGAAPTLLTPTMIQGGTPLRLRGAGTQQ